MEMSVPMTVRIEGGEILMEPGPAPRVTGIPFTVRLSPARARELAHQLIGAAARAVPTCGAGK